MTTAAMSEKKFTTFHAIKPINQVIKSGKFDQ